MTGAVVEAYFAKLVLAFFPSPAPVTIALEVQTVAVHGAVVRAMNLEAILARERVRALAHRLAKLVSVTNTVAVAVGGVTQGFSTIFAFPTSVTCAFSLDANSVVTREFASGGFAAVFPAVTFVTVAPFCGSVVRQRVDTRVTATMVGTVVGADVQFAVFAFEARVANAGVVEAEPVV